MGVESPGRPPPTHARAATLPHILLPRAPTLPPRKDPTWARVALIGCANVFNEFEALKEQVSELEKRLAEVNKTLETERSFHRQASIGLGHH
nr:hypothetical protein Iba_chr07bCG5010 [Ipomoea batatas]